MIPGVKEAAPDSLDSKLRIFDQATKRHPVRTGEERNCTTVAALVDTNVLVYRFDNRFPDKQKIATETLRRGILENSVRVPHQAMVESIATVTRLIRGHIILNWNNFGSP